MNFPSAGMIEDRFWCCENGCRSDGINPAVQNPCCRVGRRCLWVWKEVSRDDSKPWAELQSSLCLFTNQFRLYRDISPTASWWTIFVFGSNSRAGMDPTVENLCLKLRCSRATWIWRHRPVLPSCSAQEMRFDYEKSTVFRSTHRSSSTWHPSLASLLTPNPEDRV